MIDRRVIIREKQIDVDGFLCFDTLFYETTAYLSV